LGQVPGQIQLTYADICMVLTKAALGKGVSFTEELLGLNKTNVCDRSYKSALYSPACLAEVTYTQGLLDRSSKGISVSLTEGLTIPTIAVHAPAPCEPYMMSLVDWGKGTHALLLCAARTYGLWGDDENNQSKGHFSTPCSVPLMKFDTPKTKSMSGVDWGPWCISVAVFMSKGVYLLSVVPSCFVSNLMVCKSLNKKGLGEHVSDTQQGFWHGENWGLNCCILHDHSFPKNHCSPCNESCLEFKSYSFYHG
jgi:hypothetical protein